MSAFDLRFRQIHLDFHTSRAIEGVGAAFDPEEFATTLERAHVNFINCFARCHHGWIYYDTHAFPERRHPHLTRNLLKEQIDACHARGIRVPIYVTIQWDHFTATRHPEWLIVDENGCPQRRSGRGVSLYEPGFYRFLCVNSPYIDFLRAHVEEIFELLPVDGFWFDIVMPIECSCIYCRAKMAAEGLDPSDADARGRFALRTINGFKRDMTRFVRQFSDDCTIYYNAGHVGTRHRAVVDAYTHFDLESLPSGAWGYLHFPMVMRYARNLGVECVGMTGRFHTAWGDFHSFKNVEALQFECFRALALGAKCSIGDQLHPSGKIDPHTYQLIGQVYAEMQRKEPWCEGAMPVTEIGVMSPEEFLGERSRLLPPSLRGVTRMLEEGSHQFDIVDSASDLSPYKVVVLPDDIPVSSSLGRKLDVYLAGGGAIVASFESGMNDARTDFTLDALGITLASEGARDREGKLVRGRHYRQHDYVDYILPEGPIGEGLSPTEYVMYMRGVQVAPRSGTQVLADGILPYFDRTYEHFCSHRQTPSSGRVGPPAIVQNGRVIYFAHPIFSQYERNAPRWCKTLFLNAVNVLLPEPLIRHDGPSTLQVTVNEQAAKARWVVHLLHYVPERRGQDIDVIEDVIPLHDVGLSVRVPGMVDNVMCVPEQELLPFQQNDGRVDFVLPKLTGHQMIALELTNR